jgi:hypothetical protein
MIAMIVAAVRLRGALDGCVGRTAIRMGAWGEFTTA